MQGNQVFVASCPDYGQAEACIRALLEQMGGMGRFVRPGERIVLKANLLRAAPPESAICTHPAVVEAVAKLVKEAGGTPVICDSPGGALHKEAVLRNLYDKTGMAAAAAAVAMAVAAAVERGLLAGLDGGAASRQMQSGTIHKNASFGFAKSRRARGAAARVKLS